LSAAVRQKGAGEERVMREPDVWIPYCGAAPEPAEWWARWNGDPWLIALLFVAAFLVRGGPRNAQVAIGVAAFLFVSPFCALTSALFAARAAHHVVLVAVLAPLIAWSIPARARSVTLWTAASALTLWVWHAPALYAAALSHDAVYWLMQATLLASATGFWSAVRGAQPPQAVAALLGYMVQMGLLGALLTFSRQAFYAPHMLTTSAWGLSPLADQQLAGMIMWVPGALVYLAAALLMMRQMLVETPRAAAL
jgi:putative membrane protein